MRKTEKKKSLTEMRIHYTHTVGIYSPGNAFVV